LRGSANRQILFESRSETIFSSHSIKAPAVWSRRPGLRRESSTTPRKTRETAEKPPGPGMGDEMVAVFQDKTAQLGQYQVPVAEWMTDLIEQFLEIGMDPLYLRTTSRSNRRSSAITTSPAVSSRFARRASDSISSSIFNVSTMSLQRNRAGVPLRPDHSQSTIPLALHLSAQRSLLYCRGVRNYSSLFASIWRIRSSIRLEYPHSLSYQLITLTILPMTLVHLPSTVDEWLSPL